MRSTFAAFLLLCGPAWAAGSISGPATVVDGDTIVVNGTRLHLFGIDAPEAAQRCETAQGRAYPCGREAAHRLRARIGDATVTCEDRGADAKGRRSGTCRAGEEDLAAWLAAQGYAMASRSVSSAYVHQEASAWATRRGIWAGTFERPADWREDQRRVEAAAAAAGSER